ncbi:MAG: SufD family Fe-S cluster assembly protein, partial [Bacteroidetes bacterium]|nr:SufD family Fe-S cluster assembly protein [Bacteroidota bacterium]
VDHAMPHCQSRELYKGILAGHAKGVFRGRVIVRPDAQHTNAEQFNLNLLLPDTAQINTQPQLEIHADDVKCSHGSAIGRLDDDAIFYLRTRGIGETRAREMLARGFAAEVTGTLSDEPLRAELDRLVSEKLDRGSAERETA